MAIALIPLTDLDDEDDKEDKEDKGMDWTMAWKDEVTEDLDPGMAWAMADHKATKLAKHSAAEQERLKGKEGMWTPSNSNAPIEVDAKGKAEVVVVSDVKEE